MHPFVNVCRWKPRTRRLAQVSRASDQVAGHECTVSRRTQSLDEEGSGLQACLDFHRRLSGQTTKLLETMDRDSVVES